LISGEHYKAIALCLDPIAQALRRVAGGGARARAQVSEG